MAIQSNDPQAIEKLEKKLQRLKRQQEELKKVNRDYKKFGWEGVNLSESVKEVYKASMERYSYEKLPVSSYIFTNNSAEIRRIKKRLEQLRQIKNREEIKPIHHEGFSVIESKEEGRILFSFDEKPSREICRIMKSSGWNWSPTREAWVRKNLPQGWSSARYLIEKIPRLLSVSPACQQK